MESNIFFSLIVAPFKTWFARCRTASTKVGLSIQMNTKIVCPFIAYNVQLNLNIYLVVLYFGNFCSYSQLIMPNKKNLPNIIVFYSISK